MAGENGAVPGEWPSISIVQVAYNRREELSTTLRRMLDSDYPGGLEAIVVDNASGDGTAEMVRRDFPEVRLIARDENIGAPAWNDGFAVARGDWVLILDDDCYLPPDGLRQAIAAARAHEADLVSFRVVSDQDPSYVWSEDSYRTGLFMFWGCACLVRGPIIRELGYDPELFMWANELELTLRFYDRGHRHLHLPEVTAYHFKAPGDDPDEYDMRGYRINARHWGYIVAKLMRPRDAAEALIALVARCIRDALRADREAVTGVPVTVLGFIHGLRHREPLRNPELSRFYRRNFETFASPWWLARPPRDLIRTLPRELARGQRPRGIGRRQEYFAERADYYPDRATTLQFEPFATVRR